MWKGVKSGERHPANCQSQDTNPRRKGRNSASCTWQHSHPLDNQRRQHTVHILNTTRSITIWEKYEVWEFELQGRQVFMDNNTPWRQDITKIIAAFCYLRQDKLQFWFNCSYSCSSISQMMEASLTAADVSRIWARCYDARAAGARMLGVTGCRSVLTVPCSRATSKQHWPQLHDTGTD